MKFPLSFALFFAALALVAQASKADDASTQVETPVAVPALISKDATDAIIQSGNAEIEQVPEEEAIARAAKNGVILPSNGHPWMIVKTGAGFPSGINLLAEIYVNDHWTLEPGLNLTLSYGAALIGARWHPDSLCFGCKDGKVAFTLSPGAEIGHASAGLSRNAGTIITGSGEGELRVRTGRKLFLALGIRESLGTYIESGGVSYIFNPQSPSEPPPGGGFAQAPNPGNNPGSFTAIPYPAKPTRFGDTLMYIGIGW